MFFSFPPYFLFFYFFSFYMPSVTANRYSKIYNFASFDFKAFFIIIIWMGRQLVFCDKSSNFLSDE